MLEYISYILMYRGFAYSKLLRRLRLRGIVVYDVIGDGYRVLQYTPSQNGSLRIFIICRKSRD